MKKTLVRLSGIIFVSLAMGATVPRASQAQTSGAVTTHVKVTLQVPVQAKDFDPTFQNIQLTCTIQPSGSASGAAVHNDGIVEQPVVQGSFSGTIPVQFTIATQQAITPGQQWSYACTAIFANHPHSGETITYIPGPSGQAQLASGSNVVTGTFAMQ
jgi:hypothetical protein